VTSSLPLPGRGSTNDHRGELGFARAENQKSQSRRLNDLGTAFVQQQASANYHAGLPVKAILTDPPTRSASSSPLRGGGQDEKDPD